MYDGNWQLSMLVPAEAGLLRLAGVMELFVRTKFAKTTVELVATAVGAQGDYLGSYSGGCSCVSRTER